MLDRVASASDGLATAALEVRGLDHAFGTRRVLDNVTFAVARGDFTVLLGLNGAGKTTLFALITRLFHSNSGHMAVFGHDIRREPSAALARLGVVFQQPTLDLDLTVEQNLFYNASLYGMSRRDAVPRIAAELDRAGLAERRRDKTRLLSGGQRRRVELARALVHDPGLLLLDEPTVGLDTESRQMLLEHVRRLCTVRGLAVLWATHLIDEADDSARVVVLHRGRILASGPVPEVVAAAGTRTLKPAFDQLVRGVPT
jgi:ABC-2 type transport system ATP-binding protein